MTTSKALRLINSLSALGEDDPNINQLLDEATKAIGPLEGLWTQGRAFGEEPTEAIQAAGLSMLKVWGMIRPALIVVVMSRNPQRKVGFLAYRVFLCLPLLPLQSITSLEALVRILRSDNLAMESENTTLTLVLWWVEGQPGWSLERKQEAVDKVLENGVLRAYWMDPMYLAVYGESFV